VVHGQADPWPGSGALGAVLARGMAREVTARPDAAELARLFDELG
jgi:hypothetical protein